MKQIRLGLRSSTLSLRQGELISEAIAVVSPETSIKLIEFNVSGDRKRSLGETVPRDKMDWIYEIEQSVLRGEVDLAIHSAKDVPVDVASETRVKSLLKRARADDVLLTQAGLKENRQSSFEDLAPGAVVGTASLRRGAQLLRLKPDLSVKPFRGNITTRIEKLRTDQSVTGIILAAAGIDRLSLVPSVPLPISFQDFVPAVNQGTLAGQYLSARDDVLELVSQLTDSETEVQFVAERAVIAGIGADCHSAVGVLAETSGETLSLRARVLSPNGKEMIEAETVGVASNAQAIGSELAEKLLERGAAALLAGAEQ